MLRYVDPIQDKHVWAIIDEGCNSCCHGELWATNAKEKLRKLGYQFETIDNETRTITGIGEGKSNRRYTIPFAIKTTGGIAVAGAVGSRQIEAAQHPILLSLDVQAELAFVKDVEIWHD